jgi:hypothetical protein
MPQIIINSFIALLTDPKLQAEVLHDVEAAAQLALELAAHARREGGLLSLPSQLQADEVKAKYLAVFKGIGAAAKAGQLTDDEKTEAIRSAMEQYQAELKSLPV